MGFWTLLEVASMPIVQVLLISSLGALMATEYLNLLPADARKSLNKIVFVVFTPSLMFASLAKTVTLEDIISWWFMPINIGFTFLFGGIFGWIAVKLIKPKPHLEGLVMAACSSGNLGNLLLIIVPAICSEDGSPFGDHQVCSRMGMSYASFSMALGGFYIWTYTFQLIKTSAVRYKALVASEEDDLKEPNKDLDADEKANLLEAGERDHASASAKAPESTENKKIVSRKSSFMSDESKPSFWIKLVGILHQILEELMSPPTFAAILGFIFGAVKFLKNIIIGENAPLHVIQDSVTLLGDGTIPCITLILGGNLTQGLRRGHLKPLVIVAVICVRYIFLPLIGIGMVKAANHFGWLPSDPLYHFVLMIQYALPPAMNIGTKPFCFVFLVV
ncbi:OLC1v1010475C2 [Oldenlandia corymbosa var. corymbosa]|uniref:OLC1v1010475C2 n=1 Tax=Oldenlandia corymbosa var. corymbosa TaxID=529605 RepID=A0AAV1DTT7_OLDCO|nr:OLC1v1010475C2 [Oldenlandia corymbosa var. corymbosa]